jgi:hypothetical protein
VRALTLTPEWAWAVLHLEKRVENRTWAPPASAIGTTIALHAGSKRPDWPAVELMARLNGWDFVRPWGDFRRGSEIVNRPAGHALVGGSIVATMRLAGVRQVSQAEAVGWECGPFCWDLDEVKPLERPLSVGGALGLWVVPDHVRALMAPR